MGVGERERCEIERRTKREKRKRKKERETAFWGEVLFSFFRGKPATL